MTVPESRMPTESEQQALNRLADALGELDDGLDGLHRQINSLHDKLPGSPGLPLIALVKDDGTEDPERLAWTGTRLDWHTASIVGDSVRFKPSPGIYVGWRIYSSRGERLGSGDLGQQAKIRKRDTLTLRDVVIHLRAADGV